MRRLHAGDPTPLRAELKREAQGDAHMRFCQRLHAVLLVAEGLSCYEVARWLGQSPRTVERWVHRYRDVGLIGLRGTERRGRRSQIPEEILATLARDLYSSPGCLGYRSRTWDGVTLVEHLRTHYQVELSVRQAQRLKRRLLRGPVKGSGYEPKTD